MEKPDFEKLAREMFPLLEDFRGRQGVVKGCNHIWNILSAQLAEQQKRIEELEKELKLYKPDKDSDKYIQYRNQLG